MTVTGVRRSCDTFATNSPRARSSTPRRSAIRSTSAPRRPTSSRPRSAARAVRSPLAMRRATRATAEPAGVRRSGPGRAAHGTDQHDEQRGREADALAALDRSAAGQGDDDQPAVTHGADRERHPAAPDVASPARIARGGPVSGGRHAGRDAQSGPREDRDARRRSSAAGAEHARAPGRRGRRPRPRARIGEVVHRDHDECPEGRRDGHREDGDGQDEAVREHPPHHEAEPTRA